MKLGTKINIIGSLFIFVRSMRAMVRGLKQTSTILIITTCAVVTFAAFALAPRVCEEVKAKKVLS